MTDPNKIAWTCSHGCHFTEMEMEMGMSMATMNYLMEQDRIENELAEDLHCLKERSKEYLSTLEIDPVWPWYDKENEPITIAHPQVFGP